MEKGLEKSQESLISNVGEKNIINQELCDNLGCNEKKDSIDKEKIERIYNTKHAKQMELYTPDDKENYPVWCDSWGDPCSYKFAKEQAVNVSLEDLLKTSYPPIDTEASGYETVWFNGKKEIIRYLSENIEEGDVIKIGTDEYVVSDMDKFLLHLKNEENSYSDISVILRYGDDRGLTEDLHTEPYISMPETYKIHQILGEYDFETQRFGRSGFASRRSIAYVTKNEPTARTCYYISLGWDKDDYYGLTRIVKSFVWDFDKSDVRKAIEESENELKRQELVESEKKYLSASKDGKISTVEYGYDVPMPHHPDWEEIWSVRTGCCADHRRDLTHRYLGVFLHKGTKGKVILEIPDEYKGMFIGKKGVNIKSLQEKYGIKIILK